MKSCRTLAMTAGLLTLLLAASGCSRSPRVTFYNLETGPLSPLTAAGPVPELTVGPVSVPDVVDRSQLVVGGEGNRVDILETHRWAEPLKQAIPRILADNLGVLLGSDRVVVYPREGGSGGECRVQVDIRRFSATRDGVVTIDALWTVRRSADALPESGHSRVHETARSASHDDIAAAFGRALAVVSTDIARAVRSGGVPQKTIPR
jgi:uncharacterized lipoprotein YmbA